jgi:hypothetical protein
MTMKLPGADEALRELGFYWRLHKLQEPDIFLSKNP